VRFHAALALQNMGKLANVLQGNLLDALLDEKEKFAIRLLSPCVPSAPQGAVPMFQGLLRSPDEKVRQRGAEALGSLGSAGNAGVLVLITA